MKIVIAGGSGFIGQKLPELLLNEGHKIIILTRMDRGTGSSSTYD